MTGGGSFTCRELVELVTGYLEDALTPVERTRFLAHVAACPNCAAYVQQIRTTIEVAGQISVDSAADVLGLTAMSELLGAFRAWRPTD